MIHDPPCRIAGPALPRYAGRVTERLTRTIVIRALLALVVSYVLLLQGLFASAAASSRLALAIVTPGLTQTLCSGAQVPGDPVPEEAPHHAAAQSSCCAWSVSAVLDPVALPASAATVTPRRLEIGAPILFGQAVPTAILYRSITAQGSRAPPILEA